MLLRFFHISYKFSVKQNFLVYGNIFPTPLLKKWFEKITCCLFPCSDIVKHKKNFPGFTFSNFVSFFE